MLWAQRHYRNFARGQRTMYVRLVIEELIRSRTGITASAPRNHLACRQTGLSKMARRTPQGADGVRHHWTVSVKSLQCVFRSALYLETPSYVSIIALADRNPSDSTGYTTLLWKGLFIHRPRTLNPSSCPDIHLLQLDKLCAFPEFVTNQQYYKYRQ